MALNHNQAVLQAIINRLQELENAAWVLLSAMSIEAATGNLLDKIGSIVGEARLARGDADYRAGIRLCIRTNISNGRAVDIVAISVLAYAIPVPLIPNFVEAYPAAWVVDMPYLASPTYVAQKLHHARAAGTYGLVQFGMGTFVELPLYLDSATAGAVTSPGLLDSVSGGVSGAGEMTAAFAV